ncbi:hypothetical protein RLT57_11795 [Streptomyces sp. ITFR-21]|nr:hypothetical protein [Streptomyces sp. ITFR-21]WNI19652.1 hypothetical protein RLT57_11795 [Streptomyces sp. ITFR-21]
MVPLVTVTAAAGPAAPAPAPRPAAAEVPAAVAAPATRIVYAGTRFRSLGQVGTTTSSEPLFGAGPAHFDVQPAALGDTLVFASRRDEPRPQVYLRAPDGSVRKLTAGRDAAHPRLTPDGRAVVFDSAEPGGPAGATQRDLWLVRTDGTGLTRLTDTPSDEECPTVSPDGRLLAYSGDGDAASGQQIFVRPLAGGAVTRITDAPGTATEPVWNPVDDAAHRDLVAYTFTAADPATGPRLRVTGGPAGDRPLLGGEQAQWRTHGAAWLPDGDGVLFLSPDRTCDCQGDWDHVFRAPAGSADTPQLVLSEDREVGPATWVGPLDGGYAVVDRDTASAEPAPPAPPGQPQPPGHAAANVATLQDVRADGADPRDLGLPLLAEDPAADTDTDPAHDPLFRPAVGYDPWTERQGYTPDGRRIVVTRFEDGADGRIERIWTTGSDGSDPQPMPLAERGPADWDTDPAFSPDRRYLAFTRTSPGGVEGHPGPDPGPGRVLIADAVTGAILARVTPASAEQADAQPTWSADGSMLAFTRDDGAGGKHIWTVPVGDDLGTGPAGGLGPQRDLTALICPAGCAVIDDSPAFSPDGRSIAFNRKENHAGNNDPAAEFNGLLLTSVAGDDCRAVLPEAARGTADACHRELPDVSGTGPHQPRDAAWTADGAGLVISSRSGASVDSPEKLSLVDIADGALTPLTAELPGRQKEPSVQATADLSVRAPGTVPPVAVGTAGRITVDIVNNGPDASPGTGLTVAPPPGVTVTGIGFPGGACDAASLQCDVGTVASGAGVPVTVTLTGLTTGDQSVDWSVTGVVVDPQPGDNTARTVVPVYVPGPPTPTPTPSTTPSTPPSTSTSTPPPPPAPPPPPPPAAGPGLRVTAQPDPGYVGGRVVVTYTVRNGRNALATGLRLRVGLPAGIPNGGPPPGCDASWLCALPDLAPGAGAVVRVVLAPDHALTGRATGVLTTTGTDADRADNTARTTLRILQPRIVAVPDVGKPGFVTSVRGRDFPPGVPVRFAWDPGITAAAAPTVPVPDGTFVGQLLILAKDQTGPRTITARGPGFSPVTTGFLVVPGTVQPPDEVTRR